VHIDTDASSPDARLNNDLEDWSGAELIFTRPSENQFFFPGFVDTHIHASQYPNAGVFGNSSLLDWLKKYTFPLEASLASPEKARKVYGRCIARTIANGTTTAAYYATRSVDSTNILADLCLKAGQRAFVGRCNMDQNAPAYYIDADVETAVRDTEATIAHCHQVDPEGKIVRPIVTPRFGPTCSAELLKQLGDLAKRGDLPVQTHISENKDEIAWVQELFPTSKGYADVYDTAGLLHDRTILAHAIHLTDEEIELIRARNCKISHCPCSNLALTSGTAKIRTLLKKGIKVGLGTDMSGGYSPSILEAVRQATLVSRMVALAEGEEAKLSVTEALYLGTKGGADVMGLGDKIGAFKVGMQWDAILVGLGNVPDVEEEDEADQESKAESESKPGEEDSGSAEDVPMDGLLGFGGIDSDSEAEMDNPVEEEKDVKPRIDDGIQDDAVDIFGWENWEERLVKWVFNGDDRNTLGVWVAGREVYKKGGIPPTWPLDRSD
jgi:guanine deaminase